MYIATSDDFDKVWNIFKENKKWFPHVRSFHIRNRLKWGQVVFENNVVITHQIYKRNGKIGHNTDVVTQKGDCILHQIVKGQDGNARKTMDDFFKHINTNVYLTVREENTRACKFYEKVGMKQVGTISWAHDTIAGVLLETGGKIVGEKDPMAGLVWKKEI
jgi:hypothetical protein